MGKPGEITVDLELVWFISWQEFCMHWLWLGVGQQHKLYSPALVEFLRVC